MMSQLFPAVKNYPALEKLGVKFMLAAATAASDVSYVSHAVRNSTS